MGVEIERKWLVRADPADAGSGPGDAGDGGTVMRQGYVTIEADRTVRVRQAGDRSTLTVKAGIGVSRTEIEIALDAETFDELWVLARDRSIDKRRTRVPLGGDLVAELDEFAGRHAGLRLVEVEFVTEDDAGRFSPPRWFGDEVTHEEWATNSWLAVHGLPADPRLRT